MTTFPDLRSVGHFLAEQNHATLSLPIGGRTYTWSAGDLSAAAMLQLQHVQVQTRQIAQRIEAGEPVDSNTIVFDDEDEQRFGEDLVGRAALEQMATDGVLWTEMQHVMATLMAWYLHGEQAALAVWTGETTGVEPGPPAESASTTTAGSSTTRKKPGSAGSRSSRGGTSSKQGSKRATRSI